MVLRLIPIILIFVGFLCQAEVPKPVLADKKSPCDGYLSQERQALQQGWFDNSLAAVQALSNFIGKQGVFTQPVMILTRGNSGSGKTWILQNGEHPTLKKLNLKTYLSANGEAGIINPDTIKALIQKQDGSSSSEAHEEGSEISTRVTEAALKRGLNVIVDKRFLWVDSVKKTVGEAKARGYRVIMFDIDAPLDTSIIRIGSREIGGSSPNVPFDPIEEGFVQARANRLAIATDASIDEYNLFGNGKLVAQRIGKSAVHVIEAALWKDLTRTPDSSELTSTQNLYRSLLDFLSQATSASFMRPYDVTLTQSPAPAVAAPKVQPEQNAVEYFYYQVYKTGDAQSHEKLGLELIKFFKRVYPLLKIKSEYVPEQPERSADFRLTVSSQDAVLMRRLLADAFWTPVPEVGGDGQISLTYSTRRIGKRPAGIAYVEYDDLHAFLPGEAPVDLAIAAKHFILFGAKLHSLPEMPPDARVEMRQRLRFSTPFADAHHNSGFHLKQISAAIFSAQVEHYQFKKGQSDKAKVCQAVLEANQYIACALAVQQNIPGFSFSGAAAEVTKVGPWLPKMVSILQDLERSAGCR